METWHETDRVRANTADYINRRIDQFIEDNVRYFSGRPREEIVRRIEALEQEWDIERVLELLASSFSLTGIALGAVKNKIWFLLPATVLSFLFIHAVQGWCPPVPVLRRLGIRTREEIERERYALKALLGDFAGVRNESDRAGQALAAVTS
ncbi:MAG TPA: hypothetical protein VKH62_01680 [Candidatus Binatia bacterium]|nr:hypothetical protein [Candidatus Binatia bacterium]